MKTLPFLLALLSTGQLCLAFDPVEYLASKGTPEEQGWIKNGDLEAKVSTENKHAYLDIDDSSPDSGLGFRHDIDPGAATDAKETGFAFEVTGRIENSIGPSSQQVELNIPCARVVLLFSSHDGRQNVGLISKDTTKPIFSTFSDSEFHTWKIVGKATSDGQCVLSFYGDKELLTSQAVPLDGAAPAHLSFGSLGGNVASRMSHALFEKVVFRPLASGE